MRVLSGIQPTGPIHWGNYFGAIRQYIALQDNQQAFYFIANLHALTTVRDAKNLRQWTFDVALDLLALGLNPDKATLFVQSDVPEVSELCWLLMTGAPMGLLERCVAYKDKKAKGLPADAGLFTYPVLQAADILAYDSDTVPVGEDQVQHIEVCRDLAGSFNHQFGDVFVLPKAYVLETAARVPGTDRQKMSKSYNNTLAVFEDAKSQRKQIMRIVTDSRPMEEPKETAGDVLYDLFSLVAPEADRDAMAALYRRGGFGYGEIKRALADAAEKYWAEPRARRAELVAKPDYVREVLAAGAATARKKAAEVLNRAQHACGVQLDKKAQIFIHAMTHQETQKLATTFFEDLGLTLQKINESSDKTADLNGIDKNNNSFVIEVKVKFHDPQKWNATKIRLRKDEIVDQDPETHHRKTVIATMFQQAAKQLDASAKNKSDFRIVWVGFDGLDVDLRWQQVFATFYGAVYISPRESTNTTADRCYYFDNSIAHAIPDIDAVAICDGNDFQFCLNEFSPRYSQLKGTSICQRLQELGGIHDPIQAAADGLAILLHSDIPRRNEIEVIEALRQQEGVLYTPVRLKRYASHTSVRFEYSF